MTMKLQAYLWLIYLCFISGTLILCDGKLVKRQLTLTSCSIDTFNCSNGVCIDSSLMCDGHADCSDSSDETQHLCTQLFKTCPSYSFRCKYGACVHKSAKCNGKNDCVDGSDENLPECTATKNNGTLCQSVDEFSCKSGQCIDSTSICDGIRNCHDGSDETLALCKTVQCKKYSFKCKYGACISSVGKCDGIQQCADGSDEERELCSLPSKPTVPKPTNVTPSSSIKPPTQSPSKKTCVIPNVEGSIYSYHNSNPLTVLSSGTLVQQYQIVKENCEEGYHNVDPNRIMVCLETGQWTPQVSDKLCLRKCPPMNSDSVDIKCTLNGENFNCSNPSIPGTKLKQSCKPTHHLPNGQVETPIQLLCLSDGKWNGQLYTCVPYCGKLFVQNQVLISSGVKANYGTAPWNVGIYRKNNNKYDMICGGSLISPNLVVSAAHCFWHEGLTDKMLLNNDNMYKIGVGKYKRDFSVMDNEFTQIIDVGLIYLHEDFFGSSGSYAHDITVIVLPTKIKISNVVLPVCIDWSKIYKISNGSYGKVVGWGKTENGQPSPTLLEASLPYIDHYTCRNMYKNGFELFVTSDKFCAGSQSGQGVLEGDSGAGLTFVQNSLYYLTGVVSVKDPKTNDSIAVFTDVGRHVEWILDIYTNNTFI